MSVAIHLNGLRGIGGVSETHMSHLMIIQIVAGQERRGFSSESAGNVQIGWEDTDPGSAGGGWDDCMGVARGAVALPQRRRRKVRERGPQLLQLSRVLSHAAGTAARRVGRRDCRW